MLRPFKSLLNQLKNASKFGLGSPPPSPTAGPALSPMSFQGTSSSPLAKGISYVEEQEDPLNSSVVSTEKMDIVDVNTFNGILDDDDDAPLPDQDPLSDPLAVDDFVNVNESLLNSSSASDAEILIIDVNTFTKCENVESFSDAVPESDNDGDDSFSNGKDSLLQHETIVPIEEAEERSDGSDSGLGADVTLVVPVQSDADVSAESSTQVEHEMEEPILPTSPLVCMVDKRSNLKRRSQNDTLDDTNVPKRTKRTIQFDTVTVYYFPRAQGFSCVPSQGGCSLGMGPVHMHARSFTLAEHAAEQRRAHRQQMNELNPSRNAINTNASSSTDESDSDDDPSEHSGSDLDADSNGFLQPVPTRQRRVLLKAAGVRKIDVAEKDVCKEIRLSRDVCGCDCRGYCDPETCSCSMMGIKCQVDRANFPCGCTRDGCGNVIGRVEFNQARVQTHYIHTKMRLDLEKKQQCSEDVVASTSASLNCHYGVYGGSSSSNNFNSALVPTMGSSYNSGSFTHLNGSDTADTSTGQRPVGVADAHTIDLQYAFRDDYSSGALHSTAGMSANSQYDCPRLTLDSDQPNFSLKMYGNEYQHYPASYDYPNAAHSLQYNYHPPPISDEPHSKIVATPSEEAVASSSAYQPSADTENLLGSSASNCSDFLTYNSESSAPLATSTQHEVISQDIVPRDNVGNFINLQNDQLNVQTEASADQEACTYVEAAATCDEAIVDTKKTAVAAAQNCGGAAAGDVNVAESSLSNGLELDISEILKHSITEVVSA